MPIKRKDVKKRVYHDEAITYGEFYGIAVDEYIDIPTTALPFSVRVINRFMSNGITTAADLLKVLAPILKTPVSESAIDDALKKQYEYITQDCIDSIKKYLMQEEYVASKLLTLEGDGIYMAWYLTEKGMKFWATH